METKLDMSRDARKARYQEFLNLKCLPRHSEEQSRRLLWLTKQRVIDNKAAKDWDCEWDRARDSYYTGYHDLSLNSNKKALEAYSVTDTTKPVTNKKLAIA